METARRILELMFLTAWSDGRFEGSEALTIHRLAAQIPSLRELLGSAADIDLAAKARLHKEGLEPCVRDAAAAITAPAQRELAFQCCAKVSGADGRFPREEASVLQILRQEWGLSAEDVERLLVLATHP
jgi:tellurite resistance protein